MTTTDTTTFSAVTASGIATASVLFFREAVTNMIPWLICAIPLILLDLNFGLKAAKCRSEKVRFSRAFRRTFGKIVEYFAWVCFAATASIVGNYLETRGLQVNWKYVFNTIFKLGGQKVGVDASDVDSSQFVKPIEKEGEK